MLNKKGLFNLTHKAMQDLSSNVNCEAEEGDQRLVTSAEKSS